MVFGDSSTAVVLSAFFLLVALLSNVLSTKATAVLFTPIAVGVAHAVNAPVEPFAVAVVFAANCSFASPVGYQTNLLVMGPGHYRFIDFVRAGMLLWVAFSLFGPGVTGVNRPKVARSKGSRRYAHRDDDDLQRSPMRQ